MALSWKNITVTRTNCGADVFGLAGFLRDDDLICHDGPLGWIYLTAYSLRTYHEHDIDLQVITDPNPDGRVG
jgi:hypothetical protein